MVLVQQEGSHTEEGRGHPEFQLFLCLFQPVGIRLALVVLGMGKAMLRGWQPLNEGVWGEPEGWQPWEEGGRCQEVQMVQRELLARGGIIIAQSRAWQPQVHVPFSSASIEEALKSCEGLGHLPGSVKHLWLL